MRVLVTGASGFVGQHLVRLLKESGDEVLAWGFSEAEDLDGTSFDLRDASALGRRDLRGLDAVIHLAGLAQVGLSFAEPATYVSTNATMQINLFEELLRQQSFPRVLVVSTGAVYGAGQALITETSVTDATSPYVVSKLTQETLGGYYGKRGFEVIVARPFNHVGPGQQRGYLVADLCSQIALLERSGGGEIQVGNLHSSRDYTDVRDVVAAYSQLIRLGRPGEAYNVCSGNTRQGAEIADRLCQMSTVELTLAGNSALTRPTDDNTVRASNQKLRDHAQWHPTIPLDVTLADTLAYWRSRQE